MRPALETRGARIHMNSYGREVLCKQSVRLSSFLSLFT
jgi:hypothetical protein